jgi:DNA polymerase III delta prime subunit
MKLIKIKSIKYHHRGKAWNISMRKNKNFMLANGILTHNTKVSQEALRNIFETYAGNVFFILTCNTIEKIIEPIRSRCIEISFSYPKKEEVLEYVKSICVNEDMKFDEAGLNAIVDKNYPSIRNMVLILQDLHNENKDVIVANVRANNAIYEEMWLKLKEKDWRTIKDTILSTTIDARELNSYFWENGLKEENLKLIQLCCRNERDIAFGSDAKIVVVSSLLEAVK